MACHLLSSDHDCRVLLASVDERGGTPPASQSLAAARSRVRRRCGRQPAPTAAGDRLAQPGCARQRRGGQTPPSCLRTESDGPRQGRRYSPASAPSRRWRPRQAGQPGNGPPFCPLRRRPRTGTRSRGVSSEPHMPCGVPEVCPVCELQRCARLPVGHDDRPCPFVCSISSLSGSAAGWSCSAGHPPPRTPSCWCCGTRSPFCAVPLRGHGRTGPTAPSSPR